MSSSAGTRNGSSNQIQSLGSAMPFHLRKASPDLDWKIRFRIIAAKASRNNKNPNVYSHSVATVRDELVKIGFEEGESFFHEHRMLGYYGSRGQPVYYWLDLFIPSFLLDIECDGEIWHKFFDTAKRDRRRDTILKKTYGIKVLRLGSYQLRKKRLTKILMNAINKRRLQVCCEILYKRNCKELKIHRENQRESL